MPKLSDRFAAIAQRAISQSTQDGECLLFCGATDKDGYGKTTTTFQGARYDLRIHRVVLEFYLGRRLRRGQMACHSCDTPRCIARTHLFAGTGKANMKDKMAKGRQVFPGPTNPARGAKNKNSKLTDDKVRDIRKAPGALKELAAQFGVSISTVGKIKNHQTWAHVK